MNPYHVEQLRQEQERAISKTDGRIKQLEEFKNDYETLGKKLASLPEKICHPVNVPFGKLAFMPGELIHTNEVLVLLGDNWFVQRSASQANAIVKRRVAGLDKEIEALGQQKGLLQPRLDYTAQLAQEAAEKDVVEIKEAYNPAAEKEWREKHRKSVQHYHQQQHNERQSAAQQQSNREREKQQELTDEQFWARLDALEEQEERAMEMDSIGESQALRFDFKDKRQEIISEDPHHKQQCQERSSEKCESESSDEEGPKSNIITVTHTLVEETEPVVKRDFDMVAACESSIPVACTSSPTITSPSDIFMYFGQMPGPKPILKSSDKVCKSSPKTESKVTFQDGMVSLHKDDENIHQPIHIPHNSELQAFTDTVVERQPMHPTGNFPNEHASSADSSQPPKRLSKFKQRRMQQEPM